MNYSQLREEIEKIVEDARLNFSTTTEHRIMTAIDTYLEEKAVDVESAKEILGRIDGRDDERIARNRGLLEAAAIIRSKE
jgi:hypothetical protein